MNAVAWCRVLDDMIAFIIVPGNRCPEVVAAILEHPRVETECPIPDFDTSRVTAIAVREHGAWVIDMTVDAVGIGLVVVVSIDNEVVLVPGRIVRQVVPISPKAVRLPFHIIGSADTAIGIEHAQPDIREEVAFRIPLVAVGDVPTGHAGHLSLIQFEHVIGIAVFGIVAQQRIAIVSLCPEEDRVNLTVKERIRNILGSEQNLTVDAGVSIIGLADDDLRLVHIHHTDPQVDPGVIIGRRQRIIHITVAFHFTVCARGNEGEMVGARCIGVVQKESNLVAIVRVVVRRILVILPGHGQIVEPNLTGVVRTLIVQELFPIKIPEPNVVNPKRQAAAGAHRTLVAIEDDESFRIATARFDIAVIKHFNRVRDGILPRDGLQDSHTVLGIVRIILHIAGVGDRGMRRLVVDLDFNHATVEVADIVSHDDPDMAGASLVTLHRTEDRIVPPHVVSIVVATGVVLVVCSSRITVPAVRIEPATSAANIIHAAVTERATDIGPEPVSLPKLSDGPPTPLQLTIGHEASVEINLKRRVRIAIAI